MAGVWKAFSCPRSFSSLSSWSYGVESRQPLWIPDSSLIQSWRVKRCAHVQVVSEEAKKYYKQEQSYNYCV